MSWRLAFALFVSAAAMRAGPSECAECHRAVWESYQQTGMARSFARSAPIAAATFYHAASGTYFAMIERGGRWFQQQYQTAGGKPVNLSERSVDFVLGSGNHARTFLHRTASGELIELPLGWYAEKGGTWAMNPGYDRRDHEGFRRRIGYDCMFCHNAYPEIPAGAGPRSAPVFSKLPEGIDCQRCHGSGERHVRLARSGAGSGEVRRAIVNPARLVPERQMEICMQCHLETDSSPLPNSIVRYDRGPFSYRPGEPLAGFVLHFDRKEPDDRFEINGSAYRLRRSACFLKSGRMTCTTCHNPHDVPRGEKASRSYNAICRQCHSEIGARANHPPQADCVGCHMPKRRTEDAVHVVMTDHLIQRAPRRDLIAEIAEKRPSQYRGEVVLYDPPPPAKSGDEMYLAIAQVAEGANLESGIARLSDAIAKYRPANAEPYMQLGDALRRAGRTWEALAAYEQALRQEPESAAIAARFGIALAAAGQYTRAEELLKRSADDARALTQLGGVYLKQNRLEDAFAALQHAIEIDPELPEAHNALGAAYLGARNPARAEPLLREAIRLQPNYAEARLNLANLLAGAGRFEDARAEFEAALRYRENYAEAHLDYALALSKARKFGEARVHIETVLQLDRQNAGAHRLLGNLFGAQGQLQRAIVEFREAVRIRPEWDRANLDLGAALAGAGDREGALPYLKKAAESQDAGIRDEALRLLR